MKAKRRRHDATFKSRVALEAIKGIKTIQQIAKEYDVHPVQVSDWKKRMLEGLPGVFESGAVGSPEADFEVVPILRPEAYLNKLWWLGLRRS